MSLRLSEVRRAHRRTKEATEEATKPVRDEIDELKRLAQERQARWEADVAQKRAEAERTEAE